MFQLLISVLGAFVGLNTVGAANRKYFDMDSSQDMPQYIGACLQVLFISLLAVFIFLYFFRNLLSEALGITSIWVILAAVASAAIFIVNLRLGQWQVRKKPMKYGILQISLSIFNAVLSLLLVVALSYGPEGRMLGQTFAPLAFSLLAIVLLAKDGLLSFSLRKDLIKDALRFGVPLIPHVGGAFLLFSIDRFFVKKYLGLESVGVYMAAAQLAMAISICFDAFNKAYVPWLFERLKRNQQEEKNHIVKLTYGYFLLALLMAGVAFLLGPYLVVFIAGEKYAEAGSIIGLLALGQAFRGMYIMVTNYNFYSKSTALISLVTIFSGVVNLLLLIVLIPSVGLLGAAISNAISMLFMFLLAWLLASFSYPMPWFSFGENRR
ncbi:O-antigen/teichoic acid export membrane protein [Modicisalibacter xianhensis]|uniref:O-antigen/teichoic acid export membrane protein n=2 Tax=Modicisalibacter xianhensis TaxID=442341 RepID=A0A4R8FYK5_9GAMM|nr:O-antigen/teichoic acid export membrane protein [Halomonas xianhensis]